MKRPSVPDRPAAVSTRRRIAAGSAAAALALTLLASCSFEITASRYALVYGAADYPGTANDLGVTDDDARDMAAALEAAGWQVMSELPDGTVTKLQVLNDISDLASMVDPDSSALVYFSGHGFVDVDGLTKIIPTDEVPISPSELRIELDALPCRNRILILDTCYSGGFVLATDTGTLDAAPQNYGVYDDGTGGSALLEALGSYSALLAAAFESYDPYTPIVVTAAGSEELSYETYTLIVNAPNKPLSEGNGVFTRYFLQAATSGDLDGNGYVTLQEAYRYAAKKVESYWNSTYFLSYESDTGTYADFLPRISGNARDIVIF